MDTISNWKSLIEFILISKNDFRISLKEFIGQIEEVTYVSMDSSSKTKIIASHFANSKDLIVLRFYNPLVKGYNEYSKNEYFYSLQFSSPTDYGKPGLEYNETNIEGVKSILEGGVKGKEVQYIRDEKIIKSELYLLENDDTFSYKYSFTKRPIIDALLNKNMKGGGDIKQRTIDLIKVFPGLLVD